MKKVLLPILALVLAFGLALPMATPVSADIVGLWHLDEGTGTTASDSSGNGNDGTVNGATWVGGMFDNALSFDGTNDYVQVADDSSLNIAQGTWEAWLKFAALPSSDGLMNPVAKQEQYWIHASNDDSIQVKVSVGATRYIATTGADFIETGVWYHVVGTYDGETLKLYVNGELKDSNTSPSGSIDTGTEILAFGTWSSLVDYFEGIIDEVRIWDEALTANQIQQSMVSPVPVIVTTEMAGPATVCVGTEESWDITIEVCNYDHVLDVTDVVVQDGMGADLDDIEFDGIPVFDGDNVVVTDGNATLDRRGKKNKGANMVIWDVGTLTAGTCAELVVTVTTGLNPKDKQEFTSAELGHELDGGASATYLYGDPALEYETTETIPVTVDVEECP